MALIGQAGDAERRASGAAALRELALEGHVSAQFQLGVLLSSGRGAPEDLAAAVEWYRKASAVGHAQAEYNLGVMLTRGLGVPADVAEGLRLINRAVGKGVVPRQLSAA